MAARRAKVGDVEEICKLSQVMQEESPRFRGLDYDHDKWTQTVLTLTRAGGVFVAEDPGSHEIYGFLIGGVMEHAFGRDLVGQELAVFIRPDRRGGMAAKSMIQKFEEHCFRAGAESVILGISVELDTERTGKFYELLGYHNSAVAYRKVNPNG